MKLSFTTLATPDTTAVKAISLARKFGFHGIDLRVSENRGELTLSSTQGEIAEIREALQGEGVRLASLMAYRQPGTLQEGIRRHIALAERAGAEYVRVSLPTKPEELHAEAWIDRMMPELSDCLAEAAAAHVTLLIQNHYNQLNAAQCATLIKRINHPQLAMLLSTDHCLIQHEPIGTVLQEASGITKQLYIADIVRKREGYDDVLPGTGEAPLPDFYEGLGGEAYDGWVTLKWEKLWRPELADYETVFPSFMAYVHQHLHKSHTTGERLL
jgi:sugar phosphate isomerase/epimerase